MFKKTIREQQEKKNEKTENKTSKCKENDTQNDFSFSLEPVTIYRT